MRTWLDHRLDPRKEKRIRDDFTSRLEKDDGSTSHSRMGMTLRIAIEVCERNGWAYTLQAVPGLGYYLQRSPHLGPPAENADGLKTDFPA